MNDSNKEKNQMNQQENQQQGNIDTAVTCSSNNDNLNDANPTSSPPSTLATTTIDKKVVPPELPLEWTKLNENTQPLPTIRYPSDVMEFSPDETYLEIIGTAGQKITNMGKDLYKYVSSDITHLILRSHLISKMEGIREMKKLELLELYDNQVEYLECLGGDDDDINDDIKDEKDGTDGKKEGTSGFQFLKTLDMSYNVIRDMKPVMYCSNLVELYLANNKIKKIEGLSTLINLRKIDLGANRIRSMDESQLSPLINLEELWLGKNKIEKINGLSNLTKLRRLDVQSNRLTSVNGLMGQIESLEELYLAHNGIDDDGAMKEDGLQLNFQNLNTLDLSKNRLTSCRPFAHLDTLNALWLSQNDISTFESVEPISRLGMRDGAELTELYLEHNPIYNDFEYRKKLKEMIPSLEQIDANMIGATGYGSVNATCNSLPPEMMMNEMRMLQNKVIEKAKEEQQNKE